MFMSSIISRAKILSSKVFEPDVAAVSLGTNHIRNALLKKNLA